MPNLNGSTTDHGYSGQFTQSPLNNEKGAYLAISAIVVLVLFGFAALGIEAGRWYLVQAEMSKAIDGAAFAGASNVSNPNIPDMNLFVEQVAEANFPDGLLGTEVNPNFDVVIDANGKVLVNGTANVLNSVSKVLSHGGQDYSKTAVAAAGSAKMRDAEVVVILDNSGSMSGQPIADLRDAALLFVDNFEEFESDNRFSLISFATGVDVAHTLEHDYHGPLTTEINALTAEGWTNTEDALGQANSLTWSDQSGVAMNEKTGQYVVFFSDGNPTAFRGVFEYNGNDYDSVVSTATTGWWAKLYEVDKQLDFFEVSGNSVLSTPTGDGEVSGSSACGATTLEWKILEDDDYGIPWYGPIGGSSNPEGCNMNTGALNDYVDEVSRKMAVDHAQQLKDRGFQIFTIGLGSVDETFMNTISSGPEYRYMPNSSDELADVFQGIANKIKLVLIS